MTSLPHSALSCKKSWIWALPELCPVYVVINLSSREKFGRHRFLHLRSTVMEESVLAKLLLEKNMESLKINRHYERFRD